MGSPNQARNRRESGSAIPRGPHPISILRGPHPFRAEKNFITFSCKICFLFTIQGLSATKAAQRYNHTQRQNISHRKSHKQKGNEGPFQHNRYRLCWSWQREHVAVAMCGLFQWRYVWSLFSFLVPAQLRLAEPIDIERSIKELLKSYHLDFSDELVSETRSFVVEFREEIGDQKTVRDILQLLYDYRIVSSFTQFQKLLTLFLTIPVTVASAERSFSKLKLIKTYLRSTMRQSRLADHAILSIENAEAKIMDFSNLIKQFASVNSVRERTFWYVACMRGFVLLFLLLTFKIPCPPFSFNIV